ncbi:DedA family protein/thiosulfate sulfurtransferase GlpE [Pinirhizobacter soli]|uniref:DedA family protein/thiosulfate sulfurtransferase GlpE n=1 Tax=Pinirhizobacter soli TaxID=2786953 RepID=UPI00202A3F54|nr:DedA family protein/thiosulfate sulfurtransferase GlpE [Pinirhizobacter soli]
MAQHIIELIAQYGLLVVFINVLVEQAGVPLPAVPTLVVSGALAAIDRLPLPQLVGVAILACLLGDLAWYMAGRRFGSRVMRTICRISLSPDSCVKTSELRFQRWRGMLLLVSKFVPGLSTVAPPMAGAMGLTPAAFVLMDGLGSLLWAGLAIGIGYAFSAQIDTLLASLASAGTVAGEVVLALLVVYIAMKWWQRRRLLHSLEMARITVTELNNALAEGRGPLVVDIRGMANRIVDTRTIPGAILADLAGLDELVKEVPTDREMVIYCTCPNEISAARAAQLLGQRGYRRVRPLLGGLDAWADAGYPVEELVSEGLVQAPGIRPA